MQEIVRTVNDFNTQLDEAYYDSLPKEVIDDIHASIDEIIFIKKLVSVDIKSAVDLDKDEDGKIIIDITDPHRLENMEFFTAAGDHFRKHGCYTLLTPNKHPKSSYYQFWKEEKRRIREGLVRDDGEWIPGDYYWYLNYCPIMLTKKVSSKGKRAERIHDFANVWLGDYLFFHYKNQAEFLGQHIEVLKCRGVGASFKMGSIGPRNALFKAKSKTFYVASNMQYLAKDGVLTKAWDYLDFSAINTPFPRLRSKDTQLEKRIGYKDIRSGAEKGMKSDIMGLSLNNDPDAARGKRGDIIFEEYGSFPNIKKAWNVSRDSVEDGDNVFAQLCAMGCVCAGTKVWTSDGRFINVEDLTISDGIIGFDVENENIVSQSISYMQPPASKECVRISTDSRSLECSFDHPILVRRNYEELSGREKPRVYFDKKYQITRNYVTKCKKRVYTKEWVRACDVSVGDTILVADTIDKWGTSTLFDPRLVGMLIGDGSYGMRRHYDKIEYKTPSFSNCDKELLDYVLNNYKCNIEVCRPTLDGRMYNELSISGLVQKLKDIGIAGQSKDKKRLPIEYMNLTKSDSAMLLAGLFDTDGCVTIGTPKSPPRISITQSSREMLIQIKHLLEKFGITGTITKKNPRISKDRKDKNPWYCFTISSKGGIRNFKENIPLLIDYKIKNLDYILKKTYDKEIRKNNTFKNIREESVILRESIGIKPIYNLTADGHHTYLANNIITHNTGGEIGADFEGAEDMFYHPRSYNIMPLKNVFDRNSDGKGECGFFWGSYLNRSNCYDHNGMPDVTKALREIFSEFERVRKSSSDPRILTQRRAEKAVTPQDSMMKIDGTVFPVADIRDYLEKIMPKLDEFIGPHYVGDLMFDSNGKVAWRLGTFKKPIREFPLQDNKHEGAIEIFEMPALVNGEAQRNRYIAGIDGYDDDASNTVSLGSIFILDLFTDRIVAEYTGRPKFANDFFEICRRMLLFYNAVGNYENDKKGMFGYFDRKNCLFLLSDTLQSLKDVEMVKGNLYGNKAHPYYQRVITPDGWKVWGDIKIGDKLFSTNGTTTTVTDIPFDDQCDVYNVTLKDGRVISASENHLWSVIDWNGYSKIKTTKELMCDLGRSKGKYFEYKYYLPKADSVQFKYSTPPLDPYFLGLMLGDGCFTQSKCNGAYFTSSIHDMKEYAKILNYDYKTSDDRHHRFRVSGIEKTLKSMGIDRCKSRDKYIPYIYKYNSEEVRMEVLKGLMDTDGSIGYGGNPTFTSTSKRLANDVMEVARSLGINCNLCTTKNSFGEIYTIRMYSDRYVFHLKRKAAMQKLTKTRSHKTAITDVKIAGSGRCKCVTVDSDDSCYLIGDYVVTHNSKGTNSGRFINARARRLAADYMLTDAHTSDPDNRAINLHSIRSIGLLLEALKWNPNGNFDRISAFGMLMLLREDRQKFLDNFMSSETSLLKTMAFDEYFLRNSKGTLSYNIKHI